MSDTYIVTAKTIDEAIAIAKREYEDAGHEVSYDIIDMPKKGFLGIGAKDAKIKITVSKVEKVELGSLVDDLKSMKSITNRGMDKSDSKPEKKKPEKPAEKSAEKKPAEKSAEKPAEKKPAERKPAEKSAEKPAEKTVEKKPVEKSAERKAEVRAENKPAEKKTAEKTAEKAVEKKAEKTIEKTVEKTVDKTVEKDNEKTAEVKTEERRSALGNQVRQKNRRTEVKKGAPSEDIKSSGVTVSSPVGLGDFVGEEKSGFGTGSYESGRMSNDVRKKPRVTDPAKANADALKALTARPPIEAEAPAAAEKPAEKPAVKSAAKPSEKPSERPAAKSAAKPVERVQRERVQPEPKVREAVTRGEMDKALAFLNTLLADMRLNARAEEGEAVEGEEYVINGEANVAPKINITGEDTGILIGHHGETLDAIQYLVNLSALHKSNHKDGDYVKIVVDIEGYREKREETLRTLARRMAARAVKYKRNIFLEPMNAYERRIIHSELQSYENVSTHSVGSDRDRKIIITYEGPDKRERYDRRRENNASATDGEPEERKKRKPVKLPIEEIGTLLGDGEE